LIGSIRRDCLDHVIVFDEQHLRHLLKSYQSYYKRLAPTSHCRRTRRSRVPFRPMVALSRSRCWADCTTDMSDTEFPTTTGVFDDTERDMHAAGHRVQNVRGFRSVEQQGLVTLDDNDGCFGVASGFPAGCFCVVLPPEAVAILSCLDPRIGIPSLYRQAGHRFGDADILRYATVVRAERRRGRCGVLSVFQTLVGLRTRN
jgi:hypothetical protein